ncbi:MAG TPA: HlyD family efflux transporter periplasmic adaptor subunit [Burkholderiales bacterium]|nr:HlyD family efflux transporter periplasmic adaptor subunit [Burkholderiales bacterium]
MNDRAYRPIAEIAKLPAGAMPAGSAHLIRIEGELRDCRSLAELWQHLVNESAALVAFGQAVLLECVEGRRLQWRAAAVSGLSGINRDAPMLRWYEDIARNVGAQKGALSQPVAFSLPEHADPRDPCTREATLHELMWVPLRDIEDPPVAALLLAREAPWTESHRTLVMRLARAYAHGANAIRGRHRPPPAWRRHAARAIIVVAAVCAAAAFIPVPLTTLAPAEVAPQAPFVVAAPYAAVVDRILVQPGARVKPGDALVQLVDTTLRSDYEVARQRLEVARAKTLRYQQAAIDDPDAKRELAVAQTEEAVAAAERDYAQAQLGKSVIRAEQAGVALFGDPRDWAGRPVAVGEAIMRVADPAQAEFQVKVPAGDAVNLRNGARVKVFLDASPLRPLEATIVRAAYKAETDATGMATFLVTARMAGPFDASARLGSRGVAQIYGEPVTLFYYLLRRPITALRQWSGL